ncbi:MAG: hypothetical protein MUC50_15135 [Myxococcota bacterium]|nr:hypothetical protein [Myxococcota bacterium]
MMGREKIWAFAFFFATVCALGPTLTAETLGHYGPSERPHAFPDYGGTPDLAVAFELGLSGPELQVLLERLDKGDFEQRSGAVFEILNCPAGSEETLRQALYTPSAVSNEALKNAMKDAVRRGNGGDALDGLLSAVPSDAPRTALRLVVLLRALAAKRTLAAYKALIDFSPRHAGTLRAEVGRLLVGQGLSALPALVYCRAHPEEETRMFCVRWIRDMGDPLLSEQVLGIDSTRRLSQLLEAYCAVNDLDTVDVTFSLTNHSSSFVRRAARACIERYGNNSKWGVMRAYENTFGKEPPEGALVATLLQELYDHYDANRLVKVHALLERAHEKLGQDRLEEMAELYKAALAEAPSFARDEKLTAGLVALVGKYERAGDAEKALALARFTSWLLESGGTQQRSMRALQLEDGLRSAQGDQIVSAAQYHQLLSLDPQRESARKWLDANEPKGFHAARAVSKSLMVSFILFLATMLVRRRLTGRSSPERHRPPETGGCARR